MELDQVSPNRKSSFPSIPRKDSPVETAHKSIVSDNEVPLYPSIPEVEGEAVNSEVSVIMEYNILCINGIIYIYSNTT